MGLNMNAIGKERIAKRIMKNIVKTHTSLIWKEDSTELSNLKLPTSGKLRKQPM
jgi:hypothetical protein